MRLLLLLLASLALSAHAEAATLSVRVTDPAGAPVRDAVVTFHPAGGVKGPITFDWPYQVAQRDVRFEPYVLIAPVGAEVRFPNFDRVRHHVYSFSPGQRFELELYGRDETRSRRFEAAGVAAVGCNIHDRMQAYIVIVDTPFAAKTGANGEVTLPEAAGAGVLKVWHPAIRARGSAVTRPLTLSRAGAQREVMAVELRASSSAH